MGLGTIADKLRMVQGRGVGPLLERLYRRVGERAKEDRRSPGWHASEIPYLCPREMALRGLYASEIKEVPKRIRSVMRMDVGAACHKWWQNEYLGPDGILMGDWECLGCGNWVKMSLLPREKCACGRGEYEFREIRVFDEATQICGSTDGILLFQDGKWVFDLKTSNEDTMRQLREPYVGHVWQINIYMHLLGVRRGLLVYFDPACRFWRDAMAKAEGEGPESLPILEFVVEYDRKWWEKSMEKVGEAKRILEELKEGKWSGVLPKRICENPEAWRAKDCGVRGICFDEDRLVADEKRSY